MRNKKTNTNPIVGSTVEPTVEGRVGGSLQEVDETINPTPEEVENFARALKEKIKSFK